MEGNPQVAICAVYCRYSSEQQRDGHSIEAQKRACTDFITKQGWQLYKVFVDEARSGSSDDRQAFQELIADACVKNPPFRYIVVHKLDRFARNRYDSVRYKHVLNKHGVNVISASQPIVGSGDPTEVLLESLLEGMDEFYSINLARESIKGMAENARNGWYNGGYPPFGYNLTTIKTHKGLKRKLVVNPAEAKIVRHIYREYLKGKGIVTLTLALNSHDLRIRGGRPFSKNTVANILHNEKYAGDMAFGKRRNREGRQYPVKFDTVIVRNCHEPIIDRKDFDKVQALLASRHPDVTHPKCVNSDYLFSGVIRCGICGGAMKGMASHGRNERYRYYGCGKNDRIGKGTCAQKRIRADVLEAVVLSRLAKHLTSKEVISGIIRENNEALKELKSKSAGKLKDLEAGIQRIEQKRRRLFEAIEDGIGMTKEDVAPRLRELAQDRADKEAQIVDVKKALEQKPVKSSQDIVREWVEFFKGMFSDPTFWKNKPRIQSLVRQVSLLSDKIEVTYSPELSSDIDIIPVKNGAPTDQHGELRFLQTHQTRMFVIDLKDVIEASRRGAVVPALAFLKDTPEFKKPDVVVRNGTIEVRQAVPKLHRIGKVQGWALTGHSFLHTPPESPKTAPVRFPSSSR